MEKASVNRIADGDAYSPMILRVGGLPADVVEGFSSDLCLSYLRPIRDLESVLASARAKLQESLYQAVHDASAEQRRFLLAIKRDSFNKKACISIVIDRFAERVSRGNCWIRSLTWKSNSRDR